MNDIFEKMTNRHTYNIQAEIVSILLSNTKIENMQRGKTHSVRENGHDASFSIA